MSEGTLGKIVSKVGDAVSNLVQKNCLDTIADESKSTVQAYTDETAANLAGFNAFNEAFAKVPPDVGAIMAAMTDDPIFDAPNPQPNGMCIKGKEFVKLTWEFLFSKGVTFEVEEWFVTGDRAVTRWIAYREVNGEKLSLKGADIFYMKGGKVAAKLTYSKADSFLGIEMPKL